MQTGKTCRWWEPFQGVCCNGDSEYCAEFIDDGCKCWEGTAEHENTLKSL